MYIFWKITYIQYLLAILAGSALGVLLCEILMRFVESVRASIEELEKLDGLKFILIGMALVLLPLFVRGGFYVCGMSELLMKIMMVWKFVAYVFTALFIMGAVYLIRGFTRLILAILHG